MNFKMLPIKGNLEICFGSLTGCFLLGAGPWEGLEPGTLRGGE